MAGVRGVVGRTHPRGNSPEVASGVVYLCFCWIDRAVSDLHAKHLAAGRTAIKHFLCGLSSVRRKDQCKSFQPEEDRIWKERKTTWGKKKWMKSRGHPRWHGNAIWLSEAEQRGRFNHPTDEERPADESKLEEPGTLKLKHKSWKRVAICSMQTHRCPASHALMLPFTNRAHARIPPS